MLPYWLAFLPFALGSLFRKFKVDRRLGPVFVAFLVGVTMFIGLRYRVGADWSAYWTIYHLPLENYTQYARFGDRGFYFLVWLYHQADFEIWALNLSCAIIFVGGLSVFARQMPNPWLTTAVMLPYLGFILAMSGIRQASAIGFLFIAIVAYRKRRLLAASGWMLVAASFHASAIIMMGVAGLSFSRNRFQSAVIVIITALVGSYTLSSSFDTYAYRYSGDGAAVQSSGTVYRIAMNLLAAVPYLCMERRFPVLGDHERKLWHYMSLLSIACIPLLAIAPSSTAVDRFALYLFPLQAFALSWLPVVLAKKQIGVRRWTAAIVFYQCVVLFVFFSFGVNAQSSIPYRFYLFQE